MKLTTKLFLIAAATLCLVSIVSALIMTRTSDTKRVTFMLNIALAPESLRVTACESGPWTDVIITCAIEIDPVEFPMLISGYTFSQSESNESSYTLGIPKLGPEFTVATKYQAEPASFKDGGAVRVFSDAANGRAIVDIYIE